VWTELMCLRIGTSVRHLWAR